MGHASSVPGRFAALSLSAPGGGDVELLAGRPGRPPAAGGVQGMSGEDEGGVVEEFADLDEFVVGEAGGEEPVPELADGGADEAGAGAAAGPGGGVDDGADVGQAGGHHGAVDVPGPGAVGTAGVEQPAEGVLEAVVPADVLGGAGV